MYFAFPFTALTSVYTSSLQDGANIEVCRRNIYACAKCTIGKHWETFWSESNKGETLAFLTNSAGQNCLDWDQNSPATAKTAKTKSKTCKWRWNCLTVNNWAG